MERQRKFHPLFQELNHDEAVYLFYDKLARALFIITYQCNGTRLRIYGFNQVNLGARVFNLDPPGIRYWQDSHTCHKINRGGINRGAIIFYHAQTQFNFTCHGIEITGDRVDRDDFLDSNEDGYSYRRKDGQSKYDKYRFFYCG